MRALKKVRLAIEQCSKQNKSQIFMDLITSLEQECDFPLKDLADSLDPVDFELVMDVLKEWQLDRYYAGNSKAFDTSQQQLGMVQSFEN